MSIQNRLWILMGKKLSGSVTNDEEEELDTLFQQYPDVWYTYELLISVEDKERVPEEFISEIQALLKYEQTATAYGDMKAEPQVHNMWLKFAGAAIVLFVFTYSVIWGYSYLYRPFKPVNVNNEIAVLNGSKTDFTLPDGSRVVLNGGSKLTYPKNYSALKVREVFLSGEAYFKVVHDPRHPFIIHTNHFDIKDIGTTFNVKAYPGEKTTEASLIEGAIEISFKADKTVKAMQSGSILLKPRQKIVLINNVVPNNSTITQINNNLESYKVVTLDVNKESSNQFAETAWVNNELVFKNDTFEDLAKKMERKYNVAITFGDDKIKSFMLTGAFKNQTIDQALKTLQYFVPFKYQVNHDNILIESSVDAVKP